MSLEDKHIEIYNKLYHSHESLTHEEIKLSTSKEYKIFEKEFNAIKEIAYADHIRSKKKFLKSLESKKENIRFTPFIRYSAVAASIAIFFISYLFLKPTKNDLLDIEAYPNMQTMRGNEEKETNLIRAYKYYDKQNYNHAIGLFNKSTKPLTSEAQFYLGVSYLMTNEYEKAKTILSNLKNTEFKIYPVEYFLLITYLSLNDKKGIEEIYASDLSHLPKLYQDKIQKLKEN